MYIYGPLDHGCERPFGKPRPRTQAPGRVGGAATERRVCEVGDPGGSWTQVLWESGDAGLVPRVFQCVVLYMYTYMSMYTCMHA